jgi:hypothetical protein
MKTTKLREALADLQAQRSTIDEAINGLVKVLASLEGDTPATTPAPAPMRVAAEPSYIDHAATIIREAGRPLHISAIAEGIARLTGAGVTRGGIEGSIGRHIKKAKERKLIRVAPSTYGVPEFVDHERPLLAQSA